MPQFGIHFVNRNDLLKWLEQECKGGKVFGLTFVKVDGTRRTSAARLHVTKGVKGVQPTGQRPAEDARCNLLSYWDMNSGRGTDENGKPKLGHRRCNVGRILTITVKGVKYEVR